MSRIISLLFTAALLILAAPALIAAEDETLPMEPLDSSFVPSTVVTPPPPTDDTNENNAAAVDYANAFLPIRPSNSDEEAPVATCASAQSCGRCLSGDYGNCGWCGEHGNVGRCHPCVMVDGNCVGSTDDCPRHWNARACPSNYHPGRDFVLSVGAIIGISVGAASACALALCACCCWICFRRRRHHHAYESLAGHEHGHHHGHHHGAHGYVVV